MENANQNIVLEKENHRGVPYPVESLQDSLSTIDNLVSENGTAVIITKDDISRVTGKKTNSLTMTFSTYQQYGILEKAQARGFLPTATYKKYKENLYPHHEREALLEMFKNPPLYSKIVENLNGSTLPIKEKFPSLLKDEPYNVNKNSTDKASKVFFENAYFLKIIDNNNKLVFNLHDIKQMKDAAKPPIISINHNDPELFELPIPLGGSRKAYLKYPLADLKKKDIIIIAKALNFVASSLIDEDGVNDFEIVIRDLEKTKGT